MAGVEPGGAVVGDFLLFGIGRGHNNSGTSDPGNSCATLAGGDPTLWGGSHYTAVWPGTPPPDPFLQILHHVVTATDLPTGTTTGQDALAHLFFLCLPQTTVLTIAQFSRLYTQIQQVGNLPWLASVKINIQLGLVRGLFNY